MKFSNVIFKNSELFSYKYLILQKIALFSDNKTDKNTLFGHGADKEHIPGTHLCAVIILKEREKTGDVW
jgi:hypothetical protein